MSEEQESRNQLALELNCDALEVKSASFRPGPGAEGGLFSCSIGSISDETVAALDQAAQRHARVNLLFPDQPILLDLVSLERNAPHVVRIIGHTVKPTKKVMA